MFNINKKQMEKMMKQMGIESEEIPAEEVVIKTKDKEIVISEPKVTKVNMQGQETFQIIGEVSERVNKGFAEDDVELVMDQTGAPEEDVRKALEETGDIAESILKLKK